MKNLIAAAQAKRRQAHSQLPWSSSPSLVHPFSSGDTNLVQSDQEGFIYRSVVISPPILGGESKSRNKADALETEGKSGSDRRIDGGPLSCDTEAAVARDAFQGMIETLSRTKESIGRATRLAIDCAKYGIANEVGYHDICHRLCKICNPSCHRLCQGQKSYLLLFNFLVEWNVLCNANIQRDR